MRRFAGKVVLVTGAASGIGRATAERLAHEGAALMCVDVKVEELEVTARMAAEAGAAVEARVCDISDPQQSAAAVQRCVDHFGRLDALCNVAGILYMAHALDHTLEDWERIIKVNLTGTFLMCKAALPHLLESRGCIVNVASTGALAGLPWAAAYAASKGGVLALTRSLAVEFAKRGVRVNAVCPGAILTPMTSQTSPPEGSDLALVTRLMPLQEQRGPEVVAGVIALLASDDGAYMTGEHVRVDGGTLA